MGMSMKTLDRVHGLVHEAGYGWVEPSLRPVVDELVTAVSDADLRGIGQDEQALAFNVIAFLGDEYTAEHADAITDGLRLGDPAITSAITDYLHLRGAYERQKLTMDIGSLHDRLALAESARGICQAYAALRSRIRESLTAA